MAEDHVIRAWLIDGDTRGLRRRQYEGYELSF